MSKPRLHRSRRQRGFTLLEMVLVIVISGILLASVALFLRGPFQAYLDVARRAEIGDTADTALRRIDRDLRVALPNSVRVISGTTTCMEMIPTKTGGRYRAAVDGSGNGDILNFAAADASFDMFGPLSTDPAQIPVAGDRVVVYNLGPVSVGSDAYSGSDTNTVAAVGAGSLTGETKFTFGGVVKPFPFPSPASRFQVIAPTALSYVCTAGAVNAAGDGTGTLRRVSGYAITGGQTCPLAGGALLANFVTACNVVYSPGVTGRGDLVVVQIALTKANETVNLYHEVHIGNAP